jgi:hypothetical protein
MHYVCPLLGASSPINTESLWPSAQGSAGIEIPIDLKPKSSQ